MQEIVLCAPAKLNITLDITGVLPNGYHQMDMIMQTIDLFDSVKLRKADVVALNVDGKVPTNKLNTAYKAAVAFFSEVDLMAGVEIHLEKTIPVRAGMAGGSADAAAVLVGLNVLYNARLTQGELAKIGMQIGADVPFAVIGGTARVTGVGEGVKPLPAIPSCHFVVCMPEYGIRTPEAFARYDKLGSKKRPNNERAVNAIVNGDLVELAKNMGNVLEYAAQGKRTEEIATTLMQSGAIAAQMTGTGAAIFGVFTDEASAQSAKASLEKICKNCFLAKPISKGAFIEGER